MADEIAAEVISAVDISARRITADEIRADEVTARIFSVKDETGMVRAVVGLAADSEEPYIGLIDAVGRVRAVMGIQNDGISFLSLCDEDQIPRLQVGVNTESGGAVSFFNARNQHEQSISTHLSEGSGEVYCGYLHPFARLIPEGEIDGA